MQKKTSLKDIAQLVGVSTALVSYVLNNRKEGRISREVAQKIRAAAAALNYRPNQAARSLRSSKTLTIGLIVADIANPFSASLARIIEDEADLQGYTVIFGSSDENPEKFNKLLEALLNRQVDGLILSPPQNSEKALQALVEQKTPFVLLDRYFSSITADTICLDNHAATNAAVQHLLQQQKTRIGMIAYRTTLEHLQDRKNGYIDALKTAAIPFNPSFLKEIDIVVTEEAVEQAINELLLLQEPPEAIICASNLIATKALKLLRWKYRNTSSLPEILGFDETDLFHFVDPPLTYIRQPLVEMGRKATHLLLEQMNDRSERARVFVKGELITG